MSSRKELIGELISTLKQQRDELSVKIHLGEAEAKEEWGRLEERFTKLKADYEPLKNAAGESVENLAASLQLVGEEIKNGFIRLKNSL